MLLPKEVPPDRQKVMIGGVTLQNDDWGKAKAKIKEVRNSMTFFRNKRALKLCGALIYRMQC